METRLPSPRPSLGPRSPGPSSLDFSSFWELQQTWAGKADGIRQALNAVVAVVSHQQAELDLHISSSHSISALFRQSQSFPIQHTRFTYGTLHINASNESPATMAVTSADVTAIMAMCRDTIVAIEAEAFARYGRRHDHIRRWERLTPRERDVFVHMRQGLDEREIAALFHISPHTVATHRQRIYEKMGASRPLKVIAAGTEAGYFLYLT